MKALRPKRLWRAWPKGLTRRLGCPMTVAVIAGSLAMAAPASAVVPQGHSVPRPAAIGKGLGGAGLSVTTAQVCAKVAAKAGFSFNNYIGTPAGSYPVIVVAVAVGLAESGCNPNAAGSNGPTSGCPNGSTDRGLWQINNCYHSEVSDACAYQVQCNADAAFNISSKGYDWTPWSTYNSGAFASQISTAEQAVYGYSFQLRSNGDGTCLDADSADVRNGGKIFQWGCNSSDSYQQWRVVGSVGHIPILKNAGTGTCLDADSADVRNGGKIFQWACNTGDKYQQWWFYGSGQENTNGNANAGVHSVGTGSTCLDADGTAKGNGAPIFQWACNQSDVYQQWN
jgi:Lysozyme like domain/Ricin-type beta-trefoil lectin domain